MKNKDGPAAKGRKIFQRSAQDPEPGAPGTKLSLSQQAKALGWKYWARVIIGFFVMIFLAGFVSNGYLQYKYADVFSESPCKLCHDLNNATAPCFNPALGSQNVSYNRIPQTHWLTLHPLDELGFKARWLQIPCDVCAEVEGGSLAMCLNQTFAPKRIQKTINDFNLSGINFSIPAEDISS